MSEPEYPPGSPEWTEATLRSQVAAIDALPDPTPFAADRLHLVDLAAEKGIVIF